MTGSGRGVGIHSVVYGRAVEWVVHGWGCVLWRGWWLKKYIERMDAETALLRREYDVLLR
jgi:hypothetical protein